MLGWWGGTQSGTGDEWPKVHDYVDAPYTVEDEVDSP
jgi:hypothetical protein